MAVVAKLRLLLLILEEVEEILFDRRRNLSPSKMLPFVSWERQLGCSVLPEDGSMIILPKIKGRQ